MSAAQIDDVIDSIQSPQTTGTAIPPEVMSAAAVIGYIAGNGWLTYEPYRQARPDLAAKGLVLPCSLTYAVPLGVRRCIYDIESGGGVNGNIGHFADRVDRSEPFYLYTFASNGEAMLAAARGFGYEQGRDFYYLAAHATGKKHICAPDVCGYPRADITQYVFAGSYDKSVAWDYALPHSQPKPPDPYALFPTFVGDARFPNKGNERLTVEQCDGALEHPQKFRAYLQGQLRAEIKTYRDRIWRVSHFQPPAFTKPRAKPDWGDNRGARWQALNRRMKRIDAIQ